MASIRVLIVEDHPVVRQGIRDLLEKALDIEIIGETGNGRDALQMIRELSPDVLLLDMQLQGMDGIEVAQTLQKEEGSVHILALSAHNDGCYIQELLKTGVSGYLDKEEGPEFILAAVRGVASGEKGWVSRKIAAQLFNWFSDTIPSQERMTHREAQVLNQVVKGMTNRQIGCFLAISEKTVEKHMDSIFRKLSVASRTGAAVWATRNAIHQAETNILK